LYVLLFKTYTYLHRSTYIYLTYALSFCIQDAGDSVKSLVSILNISKISLEHLWDLQINTVTSVSEEEELACKWQ